MLCRGTYFFSWREGSRRPPNLPGQYRYLPLTQLQPLSRKLYGDRYRTTWQRKTRPNQQKFQTVGTVHTGNKQTTPNQYIYPTHPHI